MEFENKIHSVNIGSLEQSNPSITASEAGISNASFRKPSNTSFRKPSGRVSPIPADEVEREMKETAANCGFQLKSKYMTKMTLFVLIQVLLLLMISGFLVASLIVHVLKNHLVGGLEIWKWCLFAISVVGGFALVLWVYWPVMFLVEKVFSLDQEVIYFVYGLRRSGAFFVWWIWLLVMWLILMEQPIHNASPRSTKVLRITTRSIISVTAGSFAWVLLTIALRLMAVKCRFNRYITKVKGAAAQLDVLRCLAGQPLAAGSNAVNCFPCNNSNTAAKKGKPAESDYVKIYTLNSDNLNFLNWDYIFDNVDQSLRLSALHGIDKIMTDEEATTIAAFVFDNVLQHSSSPRSEYITKQELSRFLSDEKIKVMFQKLNIDESQPIEREAFNNWVIQVYEMRKILFQALNDNKAATKQLSLLLRAVLVIAGVLAWLLWIDVLTTQLLVAFLSSLAGGIFVFGDSVKSLFQSIIFVFVVHPFDIGDKCIIDNAQMVVDQMNILTTVFLNAKNEKTYYSNFVLSGKPISNPSRSSFLSDSVRFCIDGTTSIERMAILKEIIKQALERNTLVVEGSNDPDNITMALQFSYQQNGQNNNQTANRRSEVTRQLTDILQNMGIKFSFPTTDSSPKSTL